MTNSFYKISLDIHEHGSHVSLKAKKGDTGRLLYITLMDGRNPYVITDECRAVFTAKKADGNIIFNDCTIIGNTISYEFTPQTTSAVGKADCEIKLYGAENKLLTSASFTLLVEDTVYNEGDQVESANEFTALTALISNFTDKLAKGEMKGDKGDKGDTGDRGPQGVSVVVAPSAGCFVLEVDSSNGDIYCVTADDETHTLHFTLDDIGDLYYEITEG